MVESVIGETPFLLQIESELPDFMLADLGYICAYSLGTEELLKVTHAVGDNSDGIGAFALGGCAKLVTME